jgi:hypothetical protein
LQAIFAFGRQQQPWNHFLPNLDIQAKKLKKNGPKSKNMAIGD